MGCEWKCPWQELILYMLYYHMEGTEGRYLDSGENRAQYFLLSALCGIPVQSSVM